MLPTHRYLNLGGHFALDDNATVLETSATGTLAITQARSSSSDTLTGTDIKNHILTFNGAGSINVGTATTANGTIYESVAGGSVVKNGTGTLTFNDRNTYTGGTTVSAGTLLVNNTAGSGTGSDTVAVSNAGIPLAALASLAEASLLMDRPFSKVETNNRNYTNAQWSPNTQ